MFLYELSRCCNRGNRTSLYLILTLNCIQDSILVTSKLEWLAQCNNITSSDWLICHCFVNMHTNTTMCQCWLLVEWTISNIISRIQTSTLLYFKQHHGLLLSFKEMGKTSTNFRYITKFALSDLVWNLQCTWLRMHVKV